MPSRPTNPRPTIPHVGLQFYFWSHLASIGSLWMASRETVNDSWAAPTRVVFPTSEQAPAIMPYIHSHGRTETLLFVRPFSLGDRDLWITERTRLDRPE